jgi:hypothetical protein
VKKPSKPSHDPNGCSSQATGNKKPELIATPLFFEAVFRLIGVEGAKKLLQAAGRASEQESKRSQANGSAPNGP